MCCGICGPVVPLCDDFAKRVQSGRNLHKFRGRGDTRTSPPPPSLLLLAGDQKKDEINGM